MAGDGVSTVGGGDTDTVTADDPNLDTQAQEILNDRLDEQSSYLQQQIAATDPGPSMNDQLAQAQKIQEVSLYYSMRIQMMNAINQLLMKAVSAIKVPQG